MIKAVFFDLYNTLARFHPPREELQQRVCEEHGYVVSKKDILKGYAAADDFMASENGKRPIAKRTREERRTFFGEYERRILAGAGVEVSAEEGLEIFKAIRRVPYELALFDDAIPCLQQVKKLGKTIGLITNIYDDIQETIDRLGLTDYLHFAVTSQETGAEKPHAPIFFAALTKAAVQPDEALHVGDQYNADIVGARRVGIWPILIDRESLLNHINDVPKIRGLMEVLRYLN